MDDDLNLVSPSDILSNRTMGNYKLQISIMNET